jgi:2-polyprenyl-3-methyl-5-hydroxy-6-metoxy-1,4-benzoquinol methylase
MRKAKGRMEISSPESEPYGYSKASSRYESGSTFRYDKYDRTEILLDWVGPQKRVLELGCSAGYISRRLTQRGCSVTGVETDSAAAKQAQECCREVHVLDLNIPGWVGTLPERVFDVVLLGDVLEHLVDPARVLREIEPVLDTDGSVVISLPNVVHWATRGKILLGRFNYESIGTLDHTHLHFFTAKTARELIESAGYRITRFHPSIGGRMSGHARSLWQVLAKSMPGLFAFQLLFEAKRQKRPVATGSHR